MNHAQPRNRSTALIIALVLASGLASGLGWIATQPLASWLVLLALAAVGAAIALAIKEAIT